MQRNQMANNSSDDHAVVRELDKQLHQMRQSIKASVANYISTCKLQLDDAKAAENMLTGRLAGAPEQGKTGYRHRAPAKTERNALHLLAQQA